MQAWTDNDTATASLQYTGTNGLVQTLGAAVERGGNVWVFNVPLAAGTNHFVLAATNFAGNGCSTNFSVIQGSADWMVTPLTQDDLKYGYANVHGTIADPNATVTVNAIQATNDGSGNWVADYVPLPPGGTVALQATAHLAGGEILQTLLTYVRDPIVFTRAYGYKLDYSYVSDAEGEMASLTETYHYDVQWTRGGGGTSLETWSAVPYDTAEDVHSSQTVTVWPADNGYWPFLPGQQVINYYCNGELTESDTNTVGAPSVEWMEQSTITGSMPWLDYWAVPYSESSGREVGLFTGGQGSRGSQNLLELDTALTVESLLDPYAQDWANNNEGFTPFLQPSSPPVAVPSEQISLDTLGGMGSGGQLVTVQPAGSETRITPRAPGRYFGPLPAAKQWQLLTQTVSATPTNRARTTLGVGEEVDVYLYSPYTSPYDPVPPNWSTNVSWTTTAGSVSPLTGGSTGLTAPSNAASVTVTMHYNTVAFSTNFTVVEPTTVVCAVTVGRTYFDIGQAGAGMHITPYVGPTNVSFYQVQLMEVGQPATDVQGYFLDLAHPAPPHDYASKADHFDIQLGYDNSWPANYDWATSGVYRSPYSQGSFTWHIPAKWKVGSGPTNDLAASWDQVFTLAPDGTVTVQKFNHTVTRHVNEHYGVVIPDP